VTDPATLQVLASALRGVAEEMGVALIRSAHSANIKERRDCSTGLFDLDGRMIAQAEHIPVHLGAMPDAVAAVLALAPQPNQVFVVNDPYTGGTHLPDITLVSTVDDLGVLVSRAHHADVGGMWPGSLPANSTELFQEGLVIPPLPLTDEVLQLMLANMRHPRERLADLRAQLSCHATGAERLRELVGRYGRERLAAGMSELYAYAERRMRAAIRRLPNGRYRATDVVEPAAGGEAAIEAELRIRGGSITVDFAGTAGPIDGNLNCPLSVTRSAVYYVVRAVCAPDLEASGGAFAPVTVRAPEGCLVNARSPAAVVAGNTETSSRIVDVVMAAFGEAVPVPAMGQGTMNNVVLGNAGFGYYETIAGGQGACPGADGPDAVHVAMSNTLNTPIEVLEREYPLRVERYAVRRGSGGAGRYRGGDGVVRALRVLEDCRLSVITERRRRRPRGAAGGEDGALGENRLNGRRLAAKVSRELAAGDLLEIRTPGGGGYGPAK